MKNKKAKSPQIIGPWKVTLDNLQITVWKNGEMMKVFDTHPYTQDEDFNRVVDKVRSVYIKTK